MPTIVTTANWHQSLFAFFKNEELGWTEAALTRAKMDAWRSEHYDADHFLEEALRQKADQMFRPMEKLIMVHLEDIDWTRFARELIQWDIERATTGHEDDH